jgi:hypothetical protein
MFTVTNDTNCIKMKYFGESSGESNKNNAHCQFIIHMLVFIPQSLNNFDLLKL